MEGMMKAIRGRDKFKPLQDNDNSELRYFRESMPEIYKEHTRQCLKCNKTFEIGHKFMRLCDDCKFTEYKRRYVNVYR